MPGMGGGGGAPPGAAWWRRATEWAAAAARDGWGWRRIAWRRQWCKRRRRWQVVEVVWVVVPVVVVVLAAAVVELLAQQNGLRWCLLCNRRPFELRQKVVELKRGDCRLGIAVYWYTLCKRIPAPSSRAMWSSPGTGSSSYDAMASVSMAVN